jgi:hypothetical protein
VANFFDQFDSSGGSSQRQSSPYADAISSVESGGNYKVVGPEVSGGRGRALGKYQIMSSNVGPWSREILGREVSPQEFMANPQIQDAIFNGKFGQYVDKYGPEGASRAWFAGEKGMNNPNAKDAFGTTVAEYSRRFVNAGGVPQDARAAVQQFAPEAPDAMAYADPAKASTPAQAKTSSNFFDQFDAPQTATNPAPTAPDNPANRPRIVISRDKPAEPPPAGQGAVPDRGALDASARGAAQGLTANFSDEIRGLVEASGANPDDPASVYKLLSGALKYWSGDQEAKKRYDTAVSRERDLNKAAEEQHPIASTVGQIGGAVALPIGAGMNAATVPGRMATGAAVGAGLGGLAGAGEGKGGVDTASRAITGAATGAALGGAAPAVVEGVIRGARAAAAPVANAVRGIRDTDSEAARRVVTAIERDRAIDPAAASRLSPNEFAASVQSGGPAAIMDIGGETTRALARSAANTSPEGRAVLNRAINDRFEGQTGRVTDWLRRTFNYPDAGAQRKAIEDTAKNVNSKNYLTAMREGQHGVWSPELQRLAGAPAIRDAANAAIPSLANRGISEGFNAPRRNPLAFDKATGTASLRELEDGSRIIPDLRFWDQVKRGLDAQIGKAEKYGDNSRVEELTGLKNSLLTELDKLVPSYQKARAGAAHYFGANDALEAGQKFVTGNVSISDARRAMAEMSPIERQLFQDGFVSRFIEMLDKTGDRRNILNKIADSKDSRERLMLVLGRDKAAELEAGLRVEGIMDLARGAVQGNSTTARQLAELGLAGGAYGFSGGGLNPFSDPAAVVNAAIVYGAARGKNAINERLSRRVAEMLVSQDPRIILQGARTVARNQTLFNSLRAADRGLARIGGEQAPVTPALQAIGAGRADNQPDVQRPNGQ